MNDRPMAVDVRRLRLRLEGRAILDGVSFAARAGEHLTIVGPNGAGKTSLLRCVARLRDDWHGGVKVDGRDVRRVGRRELARILTYVPQAGGRAAPFTVRDFVLMGRYPHLSPFSSVRAEDRLAAAQALERTGMTAFADRRLPTLSGGERQKVYLAAALAQGGRVLLLDEPTTFLDPGHERDIRRILRRVNREDGVTVVAVSHDLNAAALESDRILALKEGAVAFCGPPDRFMDAAVLSGLYGGDYLLAPHPRDGMPMVLPERSAT